MRIVVKLKRGFTVDFDQTQGEPYEVAYNVELKRIFIWDPELEKWVDTCLSKDKLIYNDEHLVYNIEGD